MDNPGGGFSTHLQGQFERWLEARKPQELKMINNYQDMMRISRQDDTKGTGIVRPEKSLIFIGSTRGKIRSARAKINDTLFGSGKMPFDTTPSKEELREYSDAVEDILTYQMTEGGFKKSIKTGVDSLGTYGTGFIFGPFVREEVYKSVNRIPDGMGGFRLQETEKPYHCPYYEHGRSMDVYPDPEASDVKEGLGVYWATRKDEDFFQGLKDQPGYNNDAIEAAMRQRGIMGRTEGSELTDQARSAIQFRYEADGRIWFLRFFGKVKRSDLKAWKQEGSPDSANTDNPDGYPVENSGEELVEAIIQMAGGYIIKAEENQYKDKRRPASRCVYEDVEHEMWGVGVAENNEPHQRVTNAAFRLYLEGKSYALLKTLSVDRSAFETSEDFKRFPGKIYKMRPGLTPEQRQTALIQHDVVDVTDGWERVIEMSEDFSDDDTGITKYSQGTDSESLNKTATGISMIMSASSLPMKEVISHIDEMWIEDMVEALLDWDLEYLEPDIVALLVGEKQAKAWAEIKQLGKTSFMKWQATGSQTFMTKEVLMQKLQGFLQIVASDPELGGLVDKRELLEQTWDAGDIGKESPVLSDEDLQKKQGPPPPGPLDLEKLKGEIKAESDHQKAEIQILMKQMDEQTEQRKAELQAMSDERSRQHELDKAELQAQVQIIIQQMKDSAAIGLQSADLQVATLHKAMDIENQPEPAEPVSE